MCKPQYQDYQAKDIPSVDKDGASGELRGGSRHRALAVVLGSGSTHTQVV